MTIDAGVDKRVVAVTLSKEEHHQTSDLEALEAALGGRRRAPWPGTC